MLRWWRDQPRYVWGGHSSRNDCLCSSFDSTGVRHTSAFCGIVIVHACTSDARAGRAAFTHPGFVLFQIARFLIVSAVEMQAVAVGWQVYEITKRPLDLGYVGLAQFLPAILLFPISGHASDRFERRHVLSACYGGYAVCFALLLALAQRGGALDSFDLRCIDLDRSGAIV